MVLETIGSRLKEERSRLEKSQQELASIGGVGRASQMKYESNERSPDANYLSCIAAEGIDVQYILTGTRLPSKGRQEADTIYSTGSRDEITEYVMSVVDKALKYYGTSWNDYPKSRRVALVSAAYHFKMNEHDMIWYYKNSHLLCGMVIVDKEDLM